MLYSSLFSFLLYESKCIFFCSVALSITLFPFVHVAKCRRISFSSLLPFQVKKNKYKFIHFSMAVFVFCSVSHIYILKSDLVRWKKTNERLLVWRRVFFAFLISHFSLFIVHICSVYYLEQRNHDALAPRTPSSIFFHFDE